MVHVYDKASFSYVKINPCKKSLIFILYAFRVCIFLLFDMLIVNMQCAAQIYKIIQAMKLCFESACKT